MTFGWTHTLFPPPLLHCTVYRDWSSGARDIPCSNRLGGCCITFLSCDYAVNFHCCVVIAFCSLCVVRSACAERIIPCPIRGPHPRRINRILSYTE
ncbi:hypothetical protein BDV10DRAFT_144151 [Aspergillus recurvatus]